LLKKKKGIILVKNYSIKNTLKLILLFFTIFANSQEIDLYKDDIEKIRYYSYLNIDSLFHYSRKLEKSENQCVSNTGKNNISSAYYKSGNFKKSEEVALSVLSNIKELNSTCNIDNKLHALSRMFWIKNNERKFDEAFDYLNQKIQLLSNYSEKNKKYIRTIIFNETSLAILKNNLGFHKEAINILKKVIEKYTLLDDEYGNVYDYNLVVNKASSYNVLGESFFALNANSNNDKYLDSTLFYYKKAFDETEKFIPKHENSLSFYHLRVATVLIKRKQYKRALSLVNTFELANKSQDYYFLKSLIYKNLKRSDSSLFYSYKFLNVNKTSPNTEKNKIAIFNILANLYNENNEIDSAFKYSRLALEKLEKLNDSKTEANKTHFLYDFDQIQKINDSILTNEVKKKNKLIILFLIFVFLFVVIGYYFFNKEKKKTIVFNKPQKKDYSINLELEQTVLLELEKFEKSKNYLDSTFNINKLAKQLNTNTSYLSSIVNEKKGKTFKQYITELRINYLITIIQKDKKYKKYTIQALGEEIGYTNASSFSRSFKKFTGLTPTNYLNSLK
jgi:AraC-like DNA-binding protein